MTPNRILPLDLLRGFIMVVMALDHTSAFVSRRHSMEFWAGGWTQYPNAAEFFTRFVTHLCAPGFFFLMGAGMALFAVSRQAAGWTDTRAAATLLKRGAALLLVSQLLEVPALVLGSMAGRVQNSRPGEEGGLPGVQQMPYFLFGVIFSLGLVMIAAALFIRLRDFAWWMLGIGGVLATAAYTPDIQHLRTDFPVAARALLIPGITDHVLVLYPLIPWLALTAFGVLFGRWVHRDAKKALRWSPWIGVGLIAGALAIRAAGLPGNIRLPRDESWIEFLNFIKYPPALVFSMFMIGGNLVLLGAFARLKEGWDALLVFGQTPLAYYIAHAYLYGTVGAIFFRDGAPLWMTYLVWLAGLVPLYFICRRYRTFKLGKPAESLWRLF